MRGVAPAAVSTRSCNTPVNREACIGTGMSGTISALFSRLPWLLDRQTAAVAQLVPWDTQRQTWQPRAVPRPSGLS